MNKGKIVLLMASMVFAVIFAFSCSSDDKSDGGSSPSVGDGGSSSSEGTQGSVSSSSDDGEGNLQSYSYCLISEREICLDGPFTLKDCNSIGGLPSNSCPYGGVEPSSSSVDGGQTGGDLSSSSQGASSSSSVDRLSSSSQGASSSSDGSGAKITKSKITGVSQKGPFVEGSTATLYELNDGLIQTGRSFKSIISDGKGSFEIKGVELISPYVMLEVSGNYRNEVTGNVSGPITLFAIADIREKDNANVNLLTHLEYYRVLNLVEGGKSFAEAKKQAQKEALAEFGISGDFKNSEDMTIFGATEGDATLLAISILLQGNVGGVEFSQRLTNFAQSVKESGKWENDTAKTAIADWVWRANLAGIRSNITGWGLSSEVPDFEKYVTPYWITAYGLGGCGSANEGEIKTGKNNKEYICKYGNWQEASYKDQYCFENKNKCTYFTDTRDKQRYVYVVIGTQSWMAENLNYEAEGSICLQNLDYNCDIYGRLYNWGTAKTVCPSGWHLPTQAEWDVMTAYIGGASTEGTKLSATSGWQNNNGTDEYGFSALPGFGVIPPHDGNGVCGFGYGGSWWSASENEGINNRAYSRNIFEYGTGNASWAWNVSWLTCEKFLLFSVRCVRD